jgi:transcription-repair coupling factor (superfamily II helicase)
MLGPAIGAGEQGVLAIQRQRADRTLDDVAVELDASILDAICEAIASNLDTATPQQCRVPEDHIPEAEIRLDLYHRVARASTPAEIDQLADEITDRFGPPPRSGTESG